MKVKVAAIQDSPVFFDKDQTIDKLEKWVITYASQGCQLIVFPESFIPGYPRHFTFGASIGCRTDEGRALYQRYWEQSVSVPGPDLERLVQIARAHQTFLIVGVTERDVVNGSLYCTMLYISPTEGYLGKHRKIKPTGVERLVWAEGSGAEVLTAVETSVGRLGGLICWENYMPLARMAIYQQGVQIYVAPTADARDTWLATMQHIACEGRCFVIGCNQFFRQEDYPAAYRSWVEVGEPVICRGGSVIVSPQGQVIAGPLWGQTGALMVELDLDDVIKSKLDFDVIGHYTRPDLFGFEVKTQANRSRTSE